MKILVQFKLFRFCCFPLSCIFEATFHLKIGVNYKIGYILSIFNTKKVYIKSISAKEVFEYNRRESSGINYKIFIDYFLINLQMIIKKYIQKIQGIYIFLLNESVNLKQAWVKTRCVIFNYVTEYFEYRISDQRIFHHFTKVYLYINSCSFVNCLISFI
jgi:hypothetical protein